MWASIFKQQEEDSRYCYLHYPPKTWLGIFVLPERKVMEIQLIWSWTGDCHCSV